MITGFGRTGKLFGCETMNIHRPDQMTFAKQLSSAYYPISASVIRGDIYEAMVEPSAEVGVSAMAIPTPATRWPAPPR